MNHRRRCPVARSGLLTRRDLVRIGSLVLARNLLPDGFRRAAQADSPKAKARSVILLWMAGGVTHIDSFDPKPEAPEEIRGTLGAIDTAIPGIKFSEALPCLARQRGT